VKRERRFGFLAAATLRRRASTMLMTLLGGSGWALGFAFAFFAPLFLASMMSMSRSLTGSAATLTLQFQRR
jgi:hypothetical protein